MKRLTPEIIAKQNEQGYITVSLEPGKTFIAVSVDRKGRKTGASVLKVPAR